MMHNNGGNYLGLTGLSSSLPPPSDLNLSAKVSVINSYNIDSKIDDGMPMSGKVTVLMGYKASNPVNMKYAWRKSASGTVFNSVNDIILPSTSASVASTTSCYDNNSVAGVIPQSSTTQNGGSGKNCQLSFKFQ